MSGSALPMVNGTYTKTSWNSQLESNLSITDTLPFLEKVNCGSLQLDFLDIDIDSTLSNFS